jgi:hypothetical protein
VLTADVLELKNKKVSQSFKTPSNPGVHSCGQPINKMSVKSMYNVEQIRNSPKFCFHRQFELRPEKKILIYLDDDREKLVHALLPSEHRQLSVRSGSILPRKIPRTQTNCGFNSARQENVNDWKQKI